MSKFYKISDIDRLTISEIKQLYKDYINPEQVNIYNAFDYNDDIFEKAEGVYIFTKDGKKIAVKIDTKAINKAADEVLKN